MAGDHEIDWKKFGIGLTEAVGGIVGGVVGTVAPGTGAPIAMATGGVVKVIDATVADRSTASAEKPVSKPAEQFIAAKPVPAPVEGDDATKAYDYLIKQGWPADFVKSVMNKPPAASPVPATKTPEEQRSAEIAFWKRLLDDPTLPKELRNHYTDKLSKAEQKS